MTKTGETIPNHLMPSSTFLTTGLPLLVSAACLGVLFAGLAEHHPWIPPVIVLLACTAAYLDRLYVLRRAGRTALSLFPALEEPRATKLAEALDVRLLAVLKAPHPGAFWVSAPPHQGKPAGYLVMGTGLDHAHLDAVIAHELGHAKGRHLQLRARATVIAVGTGMVPAVLASKGPAVTMVFSLIALSMASVWFCALCRRQELESDRFAAAVVGPEQVLGMLDDLEPFAARSGLWELHPPMRTRRAALRRLTAARVLRTRISPTAPAC